MVALFVVLTIAVFVLLDILVIQRAEERLEAKTETARDSVLLVSEIGLTMADGGEKVEKKEEKEKEKKEERGKTTGGGQ